MPRSDNSSVGALLALVAVASAVVMSSGTAFAVTPDPDSGEMVTGVRPLEVHLYVPINLDTGDTTLSPESKVRLSDLKTRKSSAYLSEPIVVTLHPAADEEGHVGKFGFAPEVREEKIRTVLRESWGNAPSNIFALDQTQLRNSPEAIKEFGSHVSVGIVTAQLQVPYTITKVLYATDRAPTYRIGKTTVFDDRTGESAQLSYGQAELRIDDHLDPPEDGHWAWVTRIFHSDPKPSVADTRTDRNLQDFEQLATEIRTGLSKTKQDEILLYVHGYNTSFEDDVRSGVLLGYLTKFRGPVIVYSWPSRGALADYDADYDSADRSIPRLARLLTDLGRIHEVKKVHVVAHSMGARVTFWALQRSPNLHLGQVVMIAGDASENDFRQYFNSVARTADRFTSYSTNTDLALMLSSGLHKGARIGFWNGESRPFQMAGIDSIDATAAVTDILSHGYHLNSDLPKTDIIYVLQSKPADDRGCVHWHDTVRHDFLVYGCH